MSLPEIPLSQDNPVGHRLVVLSKKEWAHRWQRAGILKVVAGDKSK